MSRAWWLLIVGVAALLSGATGPWAHGLGIERGVLAACEAIGEGGLGHEGPGSPGAPHGPGRHAPDDCAVCVTIQSGASAGLVGAGGTVSVPGQAPAGMLSGVVERVLGARAIGTPLARGPPTAAA